MYKKKKISWLKHLDFLIVDLVSIIFSYILACAIRLGNDVPGYWMEMFIRLGIVLVLIYFLLALVQSAYKNILRRDRYQELWYTIKQVLSAFVLFVMYIYITKQTYEFSRIIYVLAAVLGVCFAYTGRIVWKRYIRVKLMNHKKLSHMLVIANESTAVEFIRSTRSRRYNVFYISGVVLIDGERKGEMLENCEIVCNASEIKQYVLTEVVDEVFISMQEGREKSDLIDYLLEAGITVHISLLEGNQNLPNRMVEKMGVHTVLTSSNNMTTDGPLLVKRLMDIAGSIVGLLVTGLIFLFVAPQIRSKDPGPIFFSQERVGKNGRRFKLYKFRSMYMDAEERKKELMAQNEMNGLMFKMENDPRILPGIGHVIRDYSLDEFPQFWNVLKGDMSLVGTRPPTVDEFMQYDAHHKMRLSFKPGITGMWQVSGRSSITDFEEIVRLDNEYIKSWTLTQDIGILLKTVLIVLRKDGSM